MNLEELKNRWNEVDVDLSDSTSLGKENLTRIARKDIKINFYKILIPEFVKGVLYLFGAFFLVVFFDFFSSLEHKVMASVSIFLLLIIPMLSIVTFIQYYKSGTPHGSPTESLHLLTRKGNRFIKLQYILAVLNVVLLCNCVVLIPLVYTEELNVSSIVTSIVVCLIIIAFLTRLIWRYYKKRVVEIQRLAESLF